MKWAPLFSLLFFVACAGDDAQPAQSESPDEQALGGPIAVAVLEPLGEAVASGIVTFESADDGVEVSYEIQGLSAGAHGFHVHENGSCEEGDDGTPGGAAGGHFNPADVPHGAPDSTAAARHVGDLGNITAGEDGTSEGTFVDAIIALEGENTIDGKAMLIHGGEDDLVSQPTGDAGGRVACGIIEMQ